MAPGSGPCACPVEDVAWRELCAVVGHGLAALKELMWGRGCGVGDLGGRSYKEDK